MVIKNLRFLLRPLATRVANMVSRAVVRGVDDARGVQALQLGVLDGETRDGVERIQEYGFTSVPLAGALAAVVFVGGRRDHGLVLGVDDARYRPKGLQPGEVALYTDEGDSVVIKRGGTVVVTARRVEIAGNTASVHRGEDLNSAITQLGTAIAAALTTMGAEGAAAPILGAKAAAAGMAVGSAVTAFNGAAQAALSQKVKLG